MRIDRLAERIIRTTLFRNFAIGVGLLVLAALYVYGLDTGFDVSSQSASSTKEDSKALPGVKASLVNVPASAKEQSPDPVSRTAATPTAEKPSQKLKGLGELELLSSKSKDWLMGTLNSNADVVVISFPKLLEQGMAMNRLAAYIEKASAPRDRVLNDVELGVIIAHAGDSPETFYLGHDYRISDIARFFNQAQQQQLILKIQEQRLLATLIETGYIQKLAHYEATAEAKALITVSHLTTEDLSLLNFASNERVLSAAILAHEISHGEFLTRALYREQSWRFWKKVLTENERTKWKVLLKGLDYDPGNEELLVNEMQALLMHTPDSSVFNAAHLLISNQELAKQRVRFALAGDSFQK